MTEAVAAGADVRPAKPNTRPKRPYFSSGPCAKPPGWAPDKLETVALGRSHRGAIGKAQAGRGDRANARAPPPSRRL